MSKSLKDLDVLPENKLMPDKLGDSAMYNGGFNEALDQLSALPVFPIFMKILQSGAVRVEICEVCEGREFIGDYKCPECFKGLGVVFKEVE